MAPHSSTPAWKLPWTEEPGRLQSMGLLRVGHDSVTSLSLFTFMHWRRKWQPTPVFLPGEFQGWWSLVGCHLWDLTELDTTETTQQQQPRNTWKVVLEIKVDVFRQRWPKLHQRASKGINMVPKRITCELCQTQIQKNSYLGRRYNISTTFI